jgi:rhamnulokinase
VTARRHLAIDLGASSGRVIEVRVDPSATDAVVAVERHRFANGPVQRVGEDGSRFEWPWSRIVSEVGEGLAAAATAADGLVDSIAIDSWAVDYGLLDEHGELVAPVAAYRDPRTREAFERVRSELGDETLFEATGIQFQPFNTIYQLAADAADPARGLDRARRLLMVPDLLAHDLCGSTVGERTNASSTQMLDGEGRWIDRFVRAIGIDPSILPTLVEPGCPEPLGRLRSEVAQATGLSSGTPLLATATHDTASAVAAAPIDDATDVYISSGTWSLIGIEGDVAVSGEDARTANLTNEHGAFGSVRTLFNMAGLWLLEESRRAIAESGRPSDLATLLAAAEDAPPWSCVFDPDDARFATPGDMPARVREICLEHGETPPSDDAGLVRSILESLALATARAIDRLARLSGRRLQRVVVVGGGSRNERLNRWIADASGLPVETGPVEATAIGNGLLQFASLEGISDLATLRELVRRSCRPRRFEPSTSSAAIDDARARFAALADRSF